MKRPIHSERETVLKKNPQKASPSCVDSLWVCAHFVQQSSEACRRVFSGRSAGDCQRPALQSKRSTDALGHRFWRCRPKRPFLMTEGRRPFPVSLGELSASLVPSRHNGPCPRARWLFTSPCTLGTPRPAPQLSSEPGCTDSEASSSNRAGFRNPSVTPTGELFSREAFVGHVFCLEGLELLPPPLLRPGC